MSVSGFQPLTKQLIKFTIIGILAVLVDLVFYYILLHVYPEKLFGYISNEVSAKTTSFLIGMNVTYYLNKSWTWRKNDRSASRMIRFYFLYGISLLLNVATNSFLLYILYNRIVFAGLPLKYGIAFTGATLVSAVLNFAGQKFWIFTEPPVEVTVEG